MNNGTSKLPVGVAVLMMVLAGCGTPEQEGDPDGTAGPDAPATGTRETVTETVTETATVTESVTQTVTETAAPTPPPRGPETEEDPLRDLIVAPQQPQQLGVGSMGEFSVPGRMGGGELPTLIGFGWTPCQVVDATQRGPLTFVDEDGDGHADAMGGSDTGAARLYEVNGERYENVDDEWPVVLHTRNEAPPLQGTMLANSPDCATLVLFLDDDGDEELDLDDDRTPTEVYGVTELRWSE